MTITEVFNNIEAETRTRTWANAITDKRVEVIGECFADWEELTDTQRAQIAACLNGGHGEPVAAKKVIKRKPRKPKVAHAEDGGLLA